MYNICKEAWGWLLLESCAVIKMRPFKLIVKHSMLCVSDVVYSQFLLNGLLSVKLRLNLMHATSLAHILIYEDDGDPKHYVI